MNTGDPLFDSLIRLGLGVLGTLLGALLLLRGYRMLWLFGGVAGFELAYFGVELLNRWFGILDNVWVRAGIAVTVGVFGALTARTRPMVAYGVVGFAVGGSICLWVARIIFSNSQADSTLTFWPVIALIVVMLLCVILFALFAIRYDEVALILLSAVVGVILITEALALNHKSELEALLALSMALVGVVVQYHDFLRDQRIAMQQKEAEAVAGQ